jgi:hypothetical protein
MESHVQTADFINSNCRDNQSPNLRAWILPQLPTISRFCAQAVLAPLHKPWSLGNHQQFCLRMPAGDLRKTKIPTHLPALRWSWRFPYRTALGRNEQVELPYVKMPNAHESWTPSTPSLSDCHRNDFRKNICNHLDGKKKGLLILLFMMMLSPSESASLVLESCFLLLWNQPINLLLSIRTVRSERPSNACNKAPLPGAVNMGLWLGPARL